MTDQAPLPGAAPPDVRDARCPVHHMWFLQSGGCAAPRCEWNLRRLYAESESQATPDSSKDLEKDKRAWSVVEHDLKLRSYKDGDPLDDVFVVVPASCEDYYRARLQQVEADHSTELRAVEGERDDLGEECFRVKVELSIAREALKEISETYTLGDPDPAADANHLRSLARDVLVRLQAKEEGT
jgi:hypothetical protein